VPSGGGQQLMPVHQAVAGCLVIAIRPRGNLLNRGAVAPRIRTMQCFWRLWPLVPSFCCCCRGRRHRFKGRCDSGKRTAWRVVLCSWFDRDGRNYPWAIFRAVRLTCARPPLPPQKKKKKKEVRRDPEHRRETIIAAPAPHVPIML